jgi:hypothetical protein
MYFNENHLQYIKDAAVTLTSGNQYLVCNTHGEQPYQPSPKEALNIDFLHAAVGLATELGELLPLSKYARDIVNVKEEISDLCWYLAVYDRYFVENSSVEAFKLAIPKYCENMLLEEATFDIQDLVLNGLLDQSKKNFIYGKPYDMPLIHEKVMRVHGCLHTICRFFQFNIDEIRNMNIAKLKKRYGDKFSAQAALNRDLVGERKVLEGT